MSNINPVIIGRQAGEAIGPTDINTTGSLTQANGVRHLVCETTMTYARVSASHAVLSCPRCRLRVVFPLEVTTFEGLVNHLTDSEEDSQSHRIGCR